MKKTILYIGWVGFGNHGDDLCYDLFVQNMVKKGQEQGIELDLTALFPSNFNEYSLARLAPDVVVLGAGSLFEPVYLKALVLAQQSSIPTAIWGSGYDSMYPSPIDPTLIDPDSAFMIRQVVQKANKIGVRGPYTLEMLNAIGAEHETLHISGDPGLLLTSENQESSLTDLVTFKKPIVAVNWGTASNRVLGENEQEVALDLATVLSELTSDYTIVIYPVWKRDVNACAKLSSLIEGQDAVYCLNRVPTITELTDLYMRSLFSINMKLHANVFSAALGVPFICLAYRMKGLDFASSLNWDRFCILFSDKSRLEMLRHAIKQLSSDLDNQKVLLTQKTAAYKGKLEQLSDEIIALLL
ncbi:MAG: polysaccharide pyruvyl transferase family protein [Firmicutes bacterium]|nr:polysaccharide pyruvyl transferase family protein [Bacillota bacterium]